jgi:hypothetical protein
MGSSPKSSDNLKHFLVILNLGSSSFYSKGFFGQPKPKGAKELGPNLNGAIGNGGGT